VLKGAASAARRRGRPSGHASSAAAAVKVLPSRTMTAALPWSTLPRSRADCGALDRADRLAALRDEFIVPDDTVYLDGNSLGALPRRTAARLAEVTSHEWGEGLIRSWNSAGWIDLPQRIGDKIAALIGAGTGEVSVADSTSLNVFKTLSAAVALQRIDAPARRVLLSESGNFPTDLYIAESIAATAGMELRLADGDRIAEALDDDVAVLLLTHVNYRSGRMHDMAACAARSSSGTSRIRRARCRSTCAAPTPTSRSAAATST